MKLDKKERLTLSFQLRILEKLYPEDSAYYSIHRKAIEDGYELHYDWITEFLSEGLSTQQCEFVVDVLDMYSFIYHSFKGLGADTSLTLEKVKFPGFDGNNEIGYMSYTKYFIEDLERFDDIKETTKGYYNSHARMIPKYKAMLLKFKQYENRYEGMDEEQILTLLNTEL